MIYYMVSDIVLKYDMIQYLIGCKLNFSTFGVLIRMSILKVSTFISLGFGPVRYDMLKA